MSAILKRMASRFPKPIHHELKRQYHGWQLRHGRFRTQEPEFDLLPQLLNPGDWAIDIGANIGHYTAEMSRLVGPQGRILALEPLPKTFELLAHTVRHLPHANVTLFNLAASDQPSLAGMTVPADEAGQDNTYLAHLTPLSAGLNVLCMPLDSLPLPHRVALVKIDAEGHERAVLDGMLNLIKRDQPTMIIEISRAETASFVESLGYTGQRAPGSPNYLFRPAIAAYQNQ